MVLNQQKTVFDAVNVVMHKEKNKYTKGDKSNTRQINYFNWRNTLPLYVSLQMDRGIYIAGSKGRNSYALLDLFTS